MRIASLALLLLLVGGALAQVPQPGVQSVVQEVGGKTGAAGQFAIDTFHSLATPLGRQPYMDRPAPINDNSSEATWSAMDVTFQVPTSHVTLGAMAGFAAGASYTLTASGTFDFAGGSGAYLADAECSTTPGDPVWRPQRYSPDHVDLVAWDAGDPARQTRFEWTPKDPFPAGSTQGDPACSQSHAYTATLTGDSVWARFVVDDPNRGDNVGQMQLRITGPAPQYTAYYQCPKWAIEDHSGNRTVGELATGTVQVDSRRNANDYPHPKNAGIDPWREAGHNGIYTCNWLVPWATYDLEVSGTYTYAEKNHFSDPWTAVERNDPTHSLWWWLRDAPDLPLPSPLADAECKQGHFDPMWLSHREDHVVVTFHGHPELGTDYHDLSLNEVWVKWFPRSGGDSGCDANHEYVIKGYRPDRLGPLHLWITDERYAENDNRGHLTVRIVRTS